MAADDGEAVAYELASLLRVDAADRCVRGLWEWVEKLELPLSERLISSALRSATNAKDETLLRRLFT